MPETWILLALAAVVLYGVAQVIGKVAIGSLAAPAMVAINFLVTMPIYVLFLLCFIATASSFQVAPVFIVFGLLAAFFGRAGYYTYLEALERGSVTVVGSITAAYPAIITVLAITLLGETLTLLQAAGVGVIILGMVGLSYSHGLSGNAHGLNRQALIMSIITLILWGVWGVFVKLALSALPITYYLGLYALVLPPLFFAYVRHKGISVKGCIPKWSLPVTIAIISVLVGQIALFSDTAAVSLGEAAIVFPLIASYPVVMILLAYVFLKERLSRRDQLLAASVVFGIVMISTI